jgi:ribosomal protein L35
MKKSLVSRIKITKKGKILRRKMNIDHFRTRKSKKNILRKRKKDSIDLKIKKVLNYNNRNNNG